MTGVPVNRSPSNNFTSTEHDFSSLRIGQDPLRSLGLKKTYIKASRLLRYLANSKYLVMNCFYFWVTKLLPESISHKLSINGKSKLSIFSSLVINSQKLSSRKRRQSSDRTRNSHEYNTGLLARSRTRIHGYRFGGVK